MKHPSLLDRRRAALAIIDLQEAFRPVIGDFAELAGRIALLAEACRLFGVPIIVTEQYPRGLGATAVEITGRLGEDYAPIEKLSFSACGVAEFDLRLREHHAEQVLVCGIEAHICVSQTVHDLLARGYQVHLISDAIGARLERNREVALRRLGRAGALESSIEMALFEMCPAGTPEFKSLQALVKTLK